MGVGRVVRVKGCSGAMAVTRVFRVRIGRLFSASRIALVTPLRDGMNLVAKEYVASQSADDPGVLILSCFAGAARELGEAVIVNPFDIEGMAEAILRGLNMPVGERKERWAAMMKILERNDITAWRERFVRALSAIDTRH